MNLTSQLFYSKTLFIYHKIRRNDWNNKTNCSKNEIRYNPTFCIDSLRRTGRTSWSCKSLLRGWTRRSRCIRGSLRSRSPSPTPTSWGSRSSRGSSSPQSRGRRRQSLASTASGANRGSLRLQQSQSPGANLNKEWEKLWHFGRKSLRNISPKKIPFHVYAYFREVNEVEREVVVRKNVTNVSASSANVSRTAIQVKTDIKEKLFR